MAVTSKPLARAVPAAGARALSLLAYLAVGLAALLPRVLDLGGFITVDEANFWLDRSATFLDALRRGDWAATAISTHPGVTTMWLGAAGLLLREALVDPGWLPGDFPTALALMRLPGALVHTGAVVLGYGLLRRMIARPAALLAAVLWAADPFVVAYSRLLHVDALAGTFMTISLLAACCFWHHGQPRRLLALSGIAAGLALLSKSPALILLPAVGLVAALAAWRQLQGRDSAGAQPSAGLWLQLAGSLARPLALWGAAAAGTAFVLWPALWADPLGAFAQLRTGVEAEGAQPHMLGNFFLGHADDAPGPLFYPVALALRLTPITLAGLGALLLWALYELRASPRGLRSALEADRRALQDYAALALFVVLFVLALSLFPKKFNRYIVPAFPALDILAAAGLYQLGRLARGAARSSRLMRAVRPAAPALVMALALANVAAWHPYGIAAFNQALGGAPAGARAFAIGWGEGFEQVAAWLNAQPDITGVVTVSRIPVVQSPYMRRGAFARTPDAGRLPPDTGYVVVYVSQVQRGAPSPPFDQFYGRAVPLHTVRIHGVEYAWIYQAPPPVQQERRASFGDAIGLLGYSVDSAPTPGEMAMLRLVWEARAAPPADYTLFAHLIGPDGGRVSQVDLPYPTSGWQAGRFVTTELPVPIPADVAPGVYRLVVGLYEPDTGRRLPLVADEPAPPELSGPNALLLAEFPLP